MSETVNVTLLELLQQADAAVERMSVTNPHRRLIATMAGALVQQAKTLAGQRTEPAPSVVLTDG